jgi:hypothetical protein
MQTAELEHQILGLAPQDRVRLTQILLESLQDLSDEEVAAIQTSAERLALQRAVEEAERDIAAGEWIDHAEISAKLKRWAGGEP